MFDDLLSGLTLTGIPILILVPAAIALLKQIGMPTSWTGVAAAILGLLAAFGIQAVHTWPVIEPWVGVVATGILLGLAANGAYSQYKHFTEVRAADQAVPPQPDLLPDVQARELSNGPSEHQFYLDAKPLSGKTTVMATMRRWFTTRDYALLDIDAVFDVAKNAYVGALFLRGNDTTCNVYRISEAGAVAFLGAVAPLTGHKLDGIAIKIGGPDGRSIVVWGCTHEAISGARDNDLQVGELSGVVLAPAAQEHYIFDSRSVGTSFVEPSDPFDPAIVRQIMREEIAALVAQFGSGGSIRQGIEDKVKDALVEVLTADPATDQRAAAWRNAMFEFVKNADANPWANILQGQDDWGRARQAELRRIIHEESTRALDG